MRPRYSIAMTAGSMLAAGILALSPIRATESADALAGWGGLRLGMTIDEARAVPGYTWSKPEQANVQTQSGATALWTILRSQAQIGVGGRSFELEADFDDKGSLNQIKLKAEDATSAFAACDGAFGKLVAEGAPVRFVPSGRTGARGGNRGNRGEGIGGT